VGASKRASSFPSISRKELTTRRREMVTVGEGEAGSHVDERQNSNSSRNSLRCPDVRGNPRTDAVTEIRRGTDVSFALDSAVAYSAMANLRRLNLRRRCRESRSRPSRFRCEARSALCIPHSAGERLHERDNGWPFERNEMFLMSENARAIARSLNASVLYARDE